MARSSHRAGNDRGLINVAIARFSAIGDVAMTVPVVYSVCRTYPDVRFVFVTRRTMAGIFVNPPANLALVGVDLKTDYVGVAGMRRLADELCRNYDIDFFVDLHDVLRTRMLRIFWRLSGIKSRAIHKGKAHKQALTRRYRKRLLPLISQRARYREAFFKAGLPVNDNFNGLFGGKGKSDPAVFSVITAPKADGAKLSDRLVRRSASSFSAVGATSSRLSGVGPTSLKAQCRWPGKNTVLRSNSL